MESRSDSRKDICVTTENQEEIQQASKKHHTEAEDLKLLWLKWLLTISKDIQHASAGIIVFIAYLLGDYFVLWLAGFAFSDILTSIPFVAYVYQGIKIFSIIVITAHFCLEYGIELDKSRKQFFIKLVKRLAKGKVQGK